MNRTSVLAALLALGGAWAQAQQPRGRVIDVRAITPPLDTFEGRWIEGRKADAARDSARALAVRGEIFRLRAERNIKNLDLIGLPLVARGLARLRAGERDHAEQDFRDALTLAPGLADGYFGLARCQSESGLLGRLPALRTRLDGLLGFLGSWRGRDALWRAALPMVLAALQAFAVAFSLALVCRHGGLLRHDLEERLGGTPLRRFSRGLALALLLLPLLLFQGWGFVSLWCLALLFTYMGALERALSVALLVATLALGPALAFLAESARRHQDPLRAAALVAVEEGPDEVALRRLERAQAAAPRDRELAYLAARLSRKAGRNDDAAAIYREILSSDGDDPVALVNLGNLEFEDNAYSAAIARYKQVLPARAHPALQATAHYNLSLAHLQVFDRQKSEEERAHADRLAAPLVAGYEARWKSDGGYAVVDVGPDTDAVRRRFAGAPDGGATAFWQRGLLTRLSAFALLCAALVGLRAWRRRARMFTLHCLKCGAPFCRRCHLGKVVGGLCTQCYHLFVVRDGVSGPARNQKLLEVQYEESRRERLFRALSLLSPGAGHIYARRTLVGSLLTLLWYGTLSVLLLGGRVLPLTQVPGSLVGHSHLLGLALVLAGLYLLANRLRPDFEAARLARSPRRGRLA